MVCFHGETKIPLNLLLLINNNFVSRHVSLFNMHTNLSSLDFNGAALKCFMNIYNELKKIWPIFFITIKKIYINIF